MEVNNEDSTFQPNHYMYLILGLFIGLYTMYYGCSNYLNPRHTYHVTPLFHHLLTYYFGSYDSLRVLKFMMITWSLFFVSTGSAPIDRLLEHFLSGGRTLYTTSVSVSNLCIQGILTLIRVFGFFVAHNIEFMHDFFSDLFTSNHLWFLAPLSWMMMAYLAIFMTRRNSLLIPVSEILFPKQNHIVHNKPSPRTKKHKFKYKHHVKGKATPVSYTHLTLPTKA